MEWDKWYTILNWKIIETENDNEDMIYDRNLRYRKMRLQYLIEEYI